MGLCQAGSSHHTGRSTARFLDWLRYVQKLESDVKELKTLFERFLAAVDKRPVGKKPDDNTQKAPEYIQKSPAPINEEKINAKRRRADAPEFIPTLRAVEAAENRPKQGASCKGKAADANGEVHHCAQVDEGEAQQMHSRRATEVTGFHTSGPEREHDPPSKKSFSAKMGNMHIMMEHVRLVLLNLKASGCNFEELKQVQWGRNLRGNAATVLAELEADDTEEEDISDFDPQPSVQPVERLPPIFPPAATIFEFDDKVVLQGLVKRPDLNGRAGLVFVRPVTVGRYAVKVILVAVGGNEVKNSELIRAKPGNIRRPTPFELAAYFKDFW